MTTTSNPPPNDNYNRAMSLARGCYQRNLISRRETLGGSTLRGKATQYRSRYIESGKNLLARLDAAGIPHRVELGPRGGYHSATLHID